MGETKVPRACRPFLLSIVASITAAVITTIAFATVNWYETTFTTIGLWHFCFKSSSIYGFGVGYGPGMASGFGAGMTMPGVIPGVMPPIMANGQHWGNAFCFYITEIRHHRYMVTLQRYQMGTMNFTYLPFFTATQVLWTIAFIISNVVMLFIFIGVLVLCCRVATAALSIFIAVLSLASFGTGLAGIIVFGVGVTEWENYMWMRLLHDPYQFISWSYILAVIGCGFQLLTTFILIMDAVYVRVQLRKYYKEKERLKEIEKERERVREFERYRAEREAAEYGYHHRRPSYHYRIDGTRPKNSRSSKVIQYRQTEM